MLPILVLVHAAMPVFKPPDESEPEWLVPADPKFKGGASYVAINMIDGKRYEGETVCFKDRYGAHISTMKNENAKDHEKHLYRSMRKYGIENFRFYFRRTFKFEGREKLNREEKEAFYARFKAAYLHPCETYWIRRLNLIKDGYNLKESGEGGAGRVWTAEQKAKQSASQPKKPVTRCKILEDGKTHQKVRLTRYDGCRAAGRANPGVSFKIISSCCTNYKGRKSAGSYLWWFCKDTDVYDEEIVVPRVGNLPGTKSTILNKATISVLKLANGFLEQWHDSMSEGGRTLSTADKKVTQGAISACCLGERKSHQGYQFRKVTTEKRKDFDEDGKRIIINTKKRKRD